MENEYNITEEAANAYLLHKAFTCPICDAEFKEHIVRTQKLRFISSDDDLHQNFRDIEPLLYDVIICPVCHYAALGMYYGKVSSKQRADIKKESSRSADPAPSPRLRSYKDAVRRFEYALLTAKYKNAKHSEVGYIYIKLAWVSRLMENENGYKIYAARALKELEEAYQSEDFPLCGMDNTTYEYLMAYLNYMLGKHDEAVKLLGRIITNRSAPSRIKEKARDLKDMIKTDDKPEE